MHVCLFLFFVTFSDLLSDTPTHTHTIHTQTDYLDCVLWSKVNWISRNHRNRIIFATLCTNLSPISLPGNARRRVHQQTIVAGQPLSMGIDFWLFQNFLFESLAFFLFSEMIRSKQIGFNCFVCYFIFRFDGNSIDFAVQFDRFSVSLNVKTASGIIVFQVHWLT